MSTTNKELNKLKNMKQELKPHIHAELIHAFADGHKIEVQKCAINDVPSHWEIDRNPLWYPTARYRIYDPLREVKEAFERGEVIELKRHLNSNWYEVYKGDVFGSDIIWLNRVSEIHPEYEWRVKPKNEVRREKLQALQEANLREIQGSGYNIVSCGNCATVFTHSVLIEESVTCPGCLEDMYLSDCPDLW